LLIDALYVVLTPSLARSCSLFVAIFIPLIASCSRSLSLY